jgi:replicative DNA helicase
MMLDDGTIDAVCELLKPESFYRPSHGMIFSALVDLRATGRPIDLVFLRDALLHRKQLDTIGGKDYLLELVHGVPSAASAEYYARIVRDKASLRGLIGTATDILRNAYEGTDDANDALEQAEEKVFAIGSAILQDNAASSDNMMADVMAELERRAESGASGLPTGYPALNEVIGGFHAGEFIVVAARPSMGKTSLLLDFARKLALTGKPVAIFSLEMSLPELAMRSLSAHARFGLGQMRRGHIPIDAWDSLKAAAAELAPIPLYCDATGGLAPTSLRARARRLRARHKIEAVFVDYIQLMQVQTAKGINRQEQVSAISRAMKAMAIELDIPVICAAQLNRGPEDREGHRPRMSDLRESGSIEQDADVVMLLHNEGYYHKGEPGYVQTGQTDLIIAKNRNGPTDTVPLIFFPAWTTFEPAAVGGGY